MFTFKLQDKSKANGVLSFLQTAAKNPHPDASKRVYFDQENGVLHELANFNLDSFEPETSPPGVTVYNLSVEQYFALRQAYVFIETSASPDVVNARNEAIKQTIAGAQQAQNELSTLGPKLYAVNRRAYNQAIAQGSNPSQNPPALSDEAVENLLNSSPDLTRALSQLSELSDLSPDELDMSINGGAQDATWMFQTNLTVALATSHHASNAFINTTTGAGIPFGILTGLTMAWVCGTSAKNIYEANAISKFKKAHDGRSPNEAQLKLIRKDAEDLRYKIIGSVCGWTMGVAILGTIFDVVRFFTGFSLAGVLLNVAFSIAAGLGQAYGTVKTNDDVEKAKFYANYKGEAGSVEKAWKEQQETPEYKFNRRKLFVTSFVGGFAWNMICSYIPTVVRSVIGGIFASTAISGAFTTLLGIADFYFSKLRAKLTQQPAEKPAQPIAKINPKHPLTASKSFIVFNNNNKATTGDTQIPRSASAAAA